MKWKQVKERWPSVEDAVKLKWGKFDEQDLTSIGGNRDVFGRILSQHYKCSTVDAFAKLDAFVDDLELQDRPLIRLSWLPLQWEKCWGRLNAARCS
jgi:alpha-glucuronidase